MKSLYALFISILLLPLSLIAQPIEAPDTGENSRMQVLQKLAGPWLSQSIYVATVLEIPKHLAKRPHSASDLAILTGTDPQALNRLLRTLASYGILLELPNETYANSALSIYLDKDHPHSLYHITRLYHEVLNNSWEQLLPTLKDPKTPGFERQNNSPLFAYIRNNPQHAELFKSAMEEELHAAIHAITKAYDFSKHKAIVDVSGGYGQLIAAVVEKYPTTQGTLFDLPEIIKEAPNQNPALNSDKITLTAGDISSDPLPAKQNLYLLKHILHDLSDTQSLSVLKKLFQAMDPDSRLLLIEPVLSKSIPNDYTKMMDLLILNLTGGQERSTQQFADLLADSGFQITRIFPTTSEFTIIEAKIR